MSDRFHSLTVVLEHDFKKEDAEDLIAAMMQLKGVISASAHIVNIETHMAEQRARTKLGQDILKVIFPPQ